MSGLRSQLSRASYPWGDFRSRRRLTRYIGDWSSDVCSSDLVVEDHGCGKHEHEPFDAERQEPRVLELLIDGSDEDRTGQVTRDESTGDEQEGGPYELGEVGQ